MLETGDDDERDDAVDEETDVSVVLASVVVTGVVLSSKTGNNAPTDTKPAKFDKLGPAAGQKHWMLSVDAVTK